MSMERLAQTLVKEHDLNLEVIRDYLEYMFVPSSSLRFVIAMDRQGELRSKIDKVMLYVTNATLEIVRVAAYYKGIASLLS